MDELVFSDKIAMKRRPDYRAVADGRQALPRQFAARIGGGAEGGVVAHHPGLCRLLPLEHTGWGESKR
jgi:hypothetical protein